jgi:hypothetical protein
MSYGALCFCNSTCSRHVMAPAMEFTMNMDRAKDNRTFGVP